MNILDAYLKTIPSDQNILDLFDNEWSSFVPGEGRLARPGPAHVFDDGRIHWASQFFGGFSGLNVLELGPLEAGHTTMLEKSGAASVLSIEANTRAFLKCLCIKELFQLQRSRFLLGDFVEYLRHSKGRFDLVVASGVLYHMLDPVELLTLIAQVTDRIFIWTHYYDDDIIRSIPGLSRKFGKPKTEVRNGVVITSSEQSYLESLNWSGFCGGSAIGSVWMTRESILNYVRSLGFGRIETAMIQPDHQNGPAFAFCASRV